MSSDVDLEAFRLSRIYAAGWNAALQAWTLADPDGRPKNPHPSGPEKARWEEGFANALKGRKGT